MAEIIEVAGSLEMSKTWEIKRPGTSSNQYFSPQNLSALFRTSQCIRSPTFSLPHTEGSWIITLVRGGQLVYAKEDSTLVLQQPSQQLYNVFNRGYGTTENLVVLIHLHGKCASGYPEKKLQLYATIEDASEQIAPKETELMLAPGSFTDQTIWYCFLERGDYYTFPLKLKISVKVEKLKQKDLLKNVPVGAAQPADLVEINNKLIDLLLSPAVSDVTFIFTDQQKVYAHQSLLAASSQVFAAMFATKMKESETKLVKIEDASIKAFRYFIRYFYAKRIDEVPLKAHVDELLYLSDKYNLAPLKDDCNGYLLKTPLQIDNCIDLYTTADRFYLDELKTKVFSFMKSSSQQLTSSPQWQKLMRENHSLALELAVRMLQGN